MRWSETHYPGGGRFLAWLDGEPVGTRRWSAGSTSIRPSSRACGPTSRCYPSSAGGVRAVRSSQRAPTRAGRRQDDARRAGRHDAHPDAVEFLEKRGFREHERMKVVRLELAGGGRSGDRAAAGHPDHLARRPSPSSSRASTTVAVEALPDIPGDGPSSPAPSTSSGSRDVDRPSMPPGWLHRRASTRRPGGSWATQPHARRRPRRRSRGTT